MKIKNSNFSLFIALISIGVLLFGIGATTPSCGNVKVQFDTSALAMNFVDNAPPVQINYGLNFPIYLQIQNNGGYAIPAGAANFYLSGIGENLIGVQSKLVNTNTLAEKTSYQLGGSEILQFATQATAAQQLSRNFNLTMKVDECYSYATLTQTDICVGKGSGICTLSGDKISTGKNSAAPVQISNLTEDITGNKLHLFFKVSNLGGGEVYLSDADCDKLQQLDLNEQLKKDRVNIAIRTDPGFTCNIQTAESPYSTVQTLEGSTQIGYNVVCEKILEGTDSHSAPTEIAISYKYRTSLTKSMTILPA